MSTATQPLEIQIWNIDRLVFYGRNPRKNDAVVDRICASIREYGFKIPVLARSDGEVVDGHLRLKAARKLGLSDRHYADFKSAVRKLIKEGRLELAKNSTIRPVSAANSVTGVFRRASGGFGFVRPDPVVGSEGGGTGFGMNAINVNAINQGGAFGNIGSLSYQGVQFGYNFNNAGGLPVTVYAGFDTLKYNPGIGSNPFGPFDTTSGTLPGYSAHAGVEFQPAPNVSLSLGFGYTQQPGDINSLALPGASPFALSGRR